MARKRKRKHRKHRAPPVPPTLDELKERVAAEQLAIIKSDPPAVSIIKIVREELLNPEAGHGVCVSFCTSYRVTDAEVARAVARGFRCFKCEDESWLS